MIELLIYHVHIVAALYAFTKRWQVEGLKGAFLALAICGLVFIIGWSLTGAIAHQIMSGPYPPGTMFTADTLSLVILLVPESAFFWFFFVRGGD